MENLINRRAAEGFPGKPACIIGFGNLVSQPAPEKVPAVIRQYCVDGFPPVAFVTAAEGQKLLMIHNGHFGFPAEENEGQPLPVLHQTLQFVVVCHQFRVVPSFPLFHCHYASLWNFRWRSVNPGIVSAENPNFCKLSPSFPAYLQKGASGRTTSQEYCSESYCIFI